jgi:hypothetical protein
LFVTWLFVKADEGFIVWVIVPSGMLAERGDKVAFKATLTHQTMIQSLLFGKRPDMVAVPSATQGQVTA